MDTIRLAVVEDIRFMRDSLKTMIEKQPDLKVVGSFSDSDNVMPRIRDAKPNMLLLNSGEEHHNVNIAQYVKKEMSATKMIAMNLPPMEQGILELMEAGVTGFVLKDASVEHFVNTIRAVAQGKIVIPPQLMDALLAHLAAEGPQHGHVVAPEDEPIAMTHREHQVIELLALGLTNKEIGSRLNISTYTVKTHVHNILDKLNVESRLQIANFAYKSKEFFAAAHSVSFLGKDE